ncbi:MAG: aminotransferase class I/II-fold pyridoxal phosphate-dependent enzyme, partial [Euryarchaeota archaeon]|nr:aminotransferase class I/II-fold pyridoxal phosphate-dependent enzyme [Euryarchaeota archaeon]
PRIREAAARAIEEYGWGACASRHIAGNTILHQRLEEQLARWVGAESAILFPTGTQANLGALTTLAAPGTRVFSDRLNHASLIDAIRLTRAPCTIYPHGDLESLEHGLRQARGAPRRIIASDTLFSMDGDPADLPRLLQLARDHDAILYLDDAHSLGALGPRGQGGPASQGLQHDPERMVVMATLGKALGASGAFVAGAHEVGDLLVNRARSLIFTTAPVPAAAAAGLAAIEITEGPEGDGLRRRLHQNATRWREGLEEMELDTRPSRSHIVPIRTGDPARTMDLSRRLLREGVFVQGIRPPSVPPGTSRLRTAPMATHTPEDIEEALRAMEKCLALAPAR